MFVNMAFDLSLAKELPMRLCPNCDYEAPDAFCRLCGGTGKYDPQQELKDLERLADTEEGRQQIVDALIVELDNL